MAEFHTDCFHCGLPVPAGSSWTLSIDAIEQPMCCPGCQVVARAIVENNLGSYYRDRISYSPKIDSLVPDALKLYDNDVLDAQFYGDSADQSLAMLSVEGIRCAACVWLIERRLSQVPGLQDAHLNVATEKLQVSWNPVQCKLSDILQAVRDVGYVAYPFDPVQHGELLRKNAKTLFRQLFIAGLSMMQVMMYALPVYLADTGTMDQEMENLMRWASLLLTLPAVSYSALPFFKGAWTNIKQRSLGMDVPVALGIGAAFIGSVLATIAGSGDVYFDSVTMFIFLLLCSRYLELIARRRAAGSLESMLHALPACAWLLQDYPNSRDAKLVAAAQLKAGDIILVKPGEAIAADGVIIEGATAVDLSLLTGESLPSQKRCGEFLPGGAINASQPILLKVDKLVRDSTLSALIRLIEHAGQGKPRIALWADQVAAWFVFILLIFSACVLGFWYWHDAARAWPIAITVLVVSCPCALSLATPSALAAATDSLLRQGVLIMQPHVLETLHRATHIIFDKTGTLTVGQPKLQHITLLGSNSRQQVLQFAAVLEAGSAHPLARALIDAAAIESDNTVGPQLDRIEAYPGQGLQGHLGKQIIRIGSAAFVAELSNQFLSDTVAAEGSAVYLGSQAGWLARFDLADALKRDAQQVIDYFKSSGKQVILLSGDSTAITNKVAQELQMDAAYAAMLPQQKLEFVQALQAQGAVVAMVGDGINDAAVLSGANVSFAMGSGAALAQSHADAVLLSSRLSSLRISAKMAAKTMGVVRQNLLWATLYNALAIPAAALGWLNPWMAGVGMSVSSTLVVGNALRLARIKK